MTSPSPKFIRLLVEKGFSFLVSFKYHIFVMSCIFLFKGKISGTEWVTTITILASLKEGIKALRTYSKGNNDGQKEYN